MTGPASRRGFLSGLATLPLIGGSVALIGSPTAAAVPVTGGTIATYIAWLDGELRYLQWATNSRGCIHVMNPGHGFHDRWGSVHRAAREAIQRAPVMLATSGCRLTCPKAEEQCGEIFAPHRWVEGVR